MSKVDAATKNDVTLECVDLTKAFGGLRAVDSLNLSFEAGKVSALIGPNGAGKTTLFHLISGALAPDSGEILYRGHRIDGLSAWTVAGIGIGRLFQDVRLFGTLTVLENVLTAFPNQPGERLSSALFRRRMVLTSERLAEREALRLLSLVDLFDQRDLRADMLSYGQSKLLAIVRLLATRADVLLLDEPTAGVSPSLTSRLVNLIRGLAKEGKMVVVIEHGMNVMLELSDWAYFMDDGQLAACGLPAEVLADDRVRARFLGSA